MQPLFIVYYDMIILYNKEKRKWCITVELLFSVRQQQVIITKKNASKLVGILHEFGTSKDCHPMPWSSTHQGEFSLLINCELNFFHYVNTIKNQYDISFHYVYTLNILINFFHCLKIFLCAGRQYHDKSCFCSRECRIQFFPLWLQWK